MPSSLAGRAALGITVVVVLVLGVLVLGPAVAACSLPPRDEEAGPVVGTGELRTEDRTGDAFERISVGAGIEVGIREGSPLAVTLSAQANLLPVIRTEVRSGQLVVTVDGPGISTSRPITLAIVVPDVRAVSLSGGATGTLDCTGAELVVDVSGGARLTATGSAGALDLTASSGARALLGGLAADAATVNLSDGATAEVRAADRVAGEVAGGATLRLTSAPAEVSVETSGGGSVQGG